jgi:hypothetical protein
MDRDSGLCAHSVLALRVVIGQETAAPPKSTMKVGHNSHVCEIFTFWTCKPRRKDFASLHTLCASRLFYSN